MTVRAPGKVVLSGAYAVLEGAPAIVSAVDRYVICDASRSAARKTPEVEAAIGAAPAPYFDASALRRDGQKLGLGSSAAIVVASLAARMPPERLQTSQGLEALAARALSAHRAAQGGGSGIDVLCSTFGGTLVVQGTEGKRRRQPVSLPPGLVVEVWASRTTASTPEMLRAVDELRRRDARGYARCMRELSATADAASAAIVENRTENLLESLSHQLDGLSALGEAAGIPIVTREVAELGVLARRAGGCFLPSGAGGGDVTVWLGMHATDDAFRARAAELGHDPIDARLGARGVHTWSGRRHEHGT